MEEPKKKCKTCLQFDRGKWHAAIDQEESEQTGGINKGPIVMMGNPKTVGELRKALEPYADECEIKLGGMSYILDGSRAELGSTWVCMAYAYPPAYGCFVDVAVLSGEQYCRIPDVMWTGKGWVYRDLSPVLNAHGIQYWRLPPDLPPEMCKSGKGKK